MSMRDIPDLSLLCLKVIAKTPTQFINEKTLARPYQAYPRPLLNSCTQMIIDYVSEAGRLTDAVFPLTSFDTDRTFLSLRNSKVTVKYLTAVLKRCPLLTSLDISGCFPIDDDVISDVLDLCPLLENLCIRNCRKLTDTALTTVQKKSKHLTVLSIGGNVNMTDNGLQRFINQFSGAPRLLELHVSGLPLSPALLAAIAKRCKNLRNISIGYAILTADTFRSFIEQMGPGLDQLSIAWAEGAVTQTANPSSSVSLGSGADFLDLVRTHCLQLTALDLTGVKNINAAAIQHFLDYKYSQMEKFPGEWKVMRHLKIKFVSVTKQQLEHLRATYPDVIFDV